MPKSAKATPPQQASLKEMWGKKKASTSAKSAKDASTSASSEVNDSKPASGACAYTTDQHCPETSTGEKKNRRGKVCKSNPDPAVIDALKTD